MPISSLVVTLDPDPLKQQRALSDLSEHTGLTLGPLQRHVLPVVLETACVQESEERFDAIARSEGVLHVDVVMVDFSDAEP